MSSFFGHEARLALTKLINDSSSTNQENLAVEIEKLDEACCRHISRIELLEQTAPINIENEKEFLKRAYDG